jgi:spore coat protein U-like protein
MKTLQITSYLLASSVLLVGVFTSLTSAQETTTVELDVLSGTVNIGSTGNFDFGDYVVTSSIQTVTGAFVGSD